MTMACKKDDAKFLAEVKAADPFDASRQKFESMVVRLQSEDMMSATHSALEAMLEVEGHLAKAA